MVILYVVSILVFEYLPNSSELPSMNKDGLYTEIFQLLHTVPMRGNDTLRYAPTSIA